MAYSMNQIIATLLMTCLTVNSLSAVPLKRGTSIIVLFTRPVNSNRDRPIMAEVANDVDVAGKTLRPENKFK